MPNIIFWVVKWAHSLQDAKQNITGEEAGDMNEMMDRIHLNFFVFHVFAVCN